MTTTPTPAAPAYPADPRLLNFLERVRDYFAAYDVEAEALREAADALAGACHPAPDDGPPTDSEILVAACRVAALRVRGFVYRHKKAGGTPPPAAGYDANDNHAVVEDMTAAAYLLEVAGRDFPARLREVQGLVNDLSLALPPEDATADPRTPAGRAPSVALVKAVERFAEGRAGDDRAYRELALALGSVIGPVESTLMPDELAAADPGDWPAAEEEGEEGRAA